MPFPNKHGFWWYRKKSLHAVKKSLQNCKENLYKLVKKTFTKRGANLYTIEEFFTVELIQMGLVYIHEVLKAFRDLCKAITALLGNVILDTKTFGGDNLSGETFDDFDRRKDWMRQQGETSNAFNAFCLFRDFGPTRSIGKVLKMHGLRNGIHSTWTVWARKYNWRERVQKYDDYNDAERLKRIEQEEIERAEAYKGMLDKMSKVVDKRIDTMRPEELTAMQALDMLDKTWELGSKVHTSQGGSSGSKNPVNGQLEITFVDTFEGL